MPDLGSASPAAPLPQTGVGTAYRTNGYIAPTTQDAPVFTYGRLSRKHKEYAKREKWWGELELLYAGGDDLAQHVERFLPKLVDESDVRYRERVKAAGYINYIAQVTDYFAGALFAQALTITPPVDDSNPDTAGTVPETPELYKAFEKDADLNQLSFSELLKGVVITALIKRWTWVCVDLPQRDEANKATSLADEEAQGLRRPYAYELAPECVLDWKEHTDRSTRGKHLLWVIVHKSTQDRETPEGDADSITEEFTIWRRGELTDGGAVTWERYCITYKADKPPKPEDQVPFTERGTTSFKRIPLLKFELKPGLWVGNLIGGLVKEHFQRRATLVSSCNRSLVTIPYAKLGAQAGGFQEPVPADVVEDQSRGDDPVGQFKRRGWMVLGKDDEVGFAAPSADAYDFTAKDLERLKDEVFRVVRQMAASAQNTPSVLGRSGHSKEQDRQSEQVILVSIGQLVRKYAAAVYMTISEALGDDVKWTVHGLDKFDFKDRDALIAETAQIDLLPIDSPTFKATHKTECALAIVENADPETKEAIRNEIKQSVAREVTAKQAMDDAAALGGQQQQVDADGNPIAPPQNAAPGQPGAGAPPQAGAPAGPKAGAVAPKPGAPKAPAAPAVPNAKAPATPAATAAPTAPVAKVPGKDGLAQASPDMHMRGISAAGVAQTVYDLLKDDYPKDAIEWVKAAHWEGPITVPLEQIDFSRRDKWQASEDVDHVNDFKEAIADGNSKPIVLVNEPNDDKLSIVDGHHRGLAYFELGQPAVAYVAHVGTVGGPWSAMHSQQFGSMQMSQQLDTKKLTSKQKNSVKDMGK